MVGKHSESISVVHSQLIHLENHTGKSRKRKSRSRQGRSTRGGTSSEVNQLASQGAGDLNIFGMKRSDYIKPGGAIDNAGTNSGQSVRGYLCFGRKDAATTAEIQNKAGLQNDKPHHRPTVSLLNPLLDNHPRIPARVMSSLVQSREASRIMRENREDSRNPIRRGVGLVHGHTLASTGILL